MQALFGSKNLQRNILSLFLLFIIAGISIPQTSNSCEENLSPGGEGVPNAVVPVSHIWEIQASLEKRLPKKFRAHAMRLLNRIARRAPEIGDNLFRWTSDRKILEELSVEIHWTDSKHASIRQMFGSGTTLPSTTLAIVGDGERPEKAERKILYFIYIDKIFPNPKVSLTKNWWDLEITLAGDLLGRISLFMHHAYSPIYVVSEMFRSRDTRWRLDEVTGRARLHYVQAEIVSQEFRARSKDMRDYLSHQLIEIEASNGYLDLRETVRQLQTVIPFDVAVDLGELNRARKMFPNFHATVATMLRRVVRFARLTEKNLFHWKAPLPKLMGKNFLLVLTTTDHPRWQSLAKFLLPYGSGSTLILPETKLGGAKSYKIVQLIYLDALIPKGIVPERRAWILEGNLAFELIGKSYLQLGADIEKLDPATFLQSELSMAEADLKGAQAQADYYRALLRSPAESLDFSELLTLRGLLYSVEGSLPVFEERLKKAAHKMNSNN